MYLIVSQSLSWPLFRLQAFGCQNVHQDSHRIELPLLIAIWRTHKKPFYGESAGSKQSLSLIRFKKKKVNDRYGEWNARERRVPLTTSSFIETRTKPCHSGIKRRMRSQRLPICIPRYSTQEQSSGWSNVSKRWHRKDSTRGGPPFWKNSSQ